MCPLVRAARAPRPTPPWGGGTNFLCPPRVCSSVSVRPPARPFVITSRPPAPLPSRRPSPLPSKKKICFFPPPALFLGLLSSASVAGGQYWSGSAKSCTPFFCLYMSLTKILFAGVPHWGKRDGKFAPAVGGGQIWARLLLSVQRCGFSSSLIFVSSPVGVRLSFIYDFFFSSLSSTSSLHLRIFPFHSKPGSVSIKKNLRGLLPLRVSLSKDIRLFL